MTRTAAHAAAHVGFGRRLGEREVVRAETRLAIRAEHLLAEIIERALQVAKRNALVNDKAFHLVELRQVARVGNVAAVHLARRDDVDRRLVFLHGVHLHARGLRAQKRRRFALHGSLLARAVDQVERILHAARRVVGGSIQGLEIVIVGLGLGAGSNGIAHAKEDVGNLIDNAVDQVTRANLLAAAGKRDVHGFRVHLRKQLRLRERFLAIRERRLDRIAHDIRSFAHFGAFFLGKLTHAAQVARKRALLAKHGHANLFERRRVGRRLDVAQGLGIKLVELVDYCHSLRLSLLCQAAVPPSRRARGCATFANKKEPSFTPRPNSIARTRSPRTKEGSRGTTLVDGLHAKPRKRAARSYAL